MKLICALSIAFALGTTSRIAAADEPSYEPKVVPQCTMYTALGVGPVCGFVDLEDWKTVLKADAELVHTRARLKQEEERTANLTTQVLVLRGQVDVYADTQKVLLERNNKLTQDLIDLDKKYQYERAKPRWGSPVAWTIAAVSTSLLAGVLLESWLD